MCNIYEDGIRHAVSKIWEIFGQKVISKRGDITRPTFECSHMPNAQFVFEYHKSTKYQLYVLLGPLKKIM